MSVNIIDLVKGYITPSVISQTATQLGESESGISKAISGFLPLVLGGLINKSGEPSLLNSLTSVAGSGVLSNLGATATQNPIIGSILSSLFGDKLGSIISNIASFANIKESSAQSLLGLTSAATLGTVGKYAAENNLDGAGLSSLLNSQKTNLSNLLPAGLSLGALGLGSLENLFGNVAHSVEDAVSSAGAKVSETISDVKHTVNDTVDNVTSHVSGNDNSGGGSSIWKWLLPLILLGLLAWFLMRQCKKSDANATPKAQDSATVKNDTVKAATIDKVDTDIDLNGVTLKGYKGGLEDAMITYLKSGAYKTDDDAKLKETWYNFDHVNFKMGSAKELEAGSQGQIENLAKILKAFPDAKIKVGGYTDKTGNEQTNLKLSQERADFIKSELTKLGVGSQILEAKGYGSEFAKVDAKASDAERATDRKMAVRFAK